MNDSSKPARCSPNQRRHCRARHAARILLSRGQTGARVGRLAHGIRSCIVTPNMAHRLSHLRSRLGSVVQRYGTSVGTCFPHEPVRSHVKRKHRQTRSSASDHQLFFLTDLSSGSPDFGPNEASPVAASTRTSAQSCRFPTIVASMTLYQTRSSS